MNEHYKAMPIEPFEVMQRLLSPDEYLGFLKGNVIKYSLRVGHKENTDDVAKAIHYMRLVDDFI